MNDNRPVYTSPTSSYSVTNGPNLGRPTSFGCITSTPPQRPQSIQSTRPTPALHQPITDPTETQTRANVLEWHNKLNGKRGCKPLDDVMQLVEIVLPHIKKGWGLSMAMTDVLPTVSSTILNFKKDGKGDAILIPELLAAYNKIINKATEASIRIDEYKPLDLLKEFDSLKHTQKDTKGRLNTMTLALGFTIINDPQLSREERTRFLNEQLLPFANDLKAQSFLPNEPKYKLDFCELVAEIYKAANQSATGLEYLGQIQDALKLKKRDDKLQFQELMQELENPINPQ